MRSASPSAGPSLASLARLGFGFGLAWVWLAALRLFGLDFGLDFGWIWIWRSFTWILLGIGSIWAGFGFDFGWIWLDFG